MDLKDSSLDRRTPLVAPLGGPDGLGASVSREVKGHREWEAHRRHSPAFLLFIKPHQPRKAQEIKEVIRVPCVSKI